MAVKFCTLLSGSSGNCTYIESNGVAILIDAGGTFKKIKELIDVAGGDISLVQGIFITHEHSDHISGLRVLSHQLNIPIIANPNTISAILSSNITFDDELFVPLETGSCAAACEFEIKSFATPHDSVESVGYIINTGNIKLAVATDMGHLTESFLKNSTGCDLVLMESNYDEDMLSEGSYPAFLKKRILSKHGHLSNIDAAQGATYLASTGVKHIVLGHLSKDNNTPNTAYKAVFDQLQKNGVKIGKDLSLITAPRYNVSDIFTFMG